MADRLNLILKSQKGRQLISFSFKVSPLIEQEEDVLIATAEDVDLESNLRPLVQK